MKLLDLPAEPWRNGGGLTRTVARGASAADGGELWRVSAAEITASGAFSRFAGMDRQAVLIAGGPLVLSVAGALHSLAQLGDTAHFTGEADAAARLVGQPARLWNVMTRRGLASAHIALRRASDGPVFCQACAQQRHIVLVLAGKAHGHHGGVNLVLDAGQVFIPNELDGHWVLQPDGEQTLLLHTTLVL